jgi:serine/threonine protein kinase/GTPase SAR1 family protein
MNRKNKNDLAAMLAQATPEQQKQMLGERLYMLIIPTQPELAGKITGMLLEGLDTAELVGLIDSGLALDEKIKLALEALKKHTVAPGQAAVRPPTGPDETPETTELRETLLKIKSRENVGGSPSFISVHQAVNFFERFDVHIHEKFDRRHCTTNEYESLVLWSNSTGGGLQKAVISTIRFSHTIGNLSVDEYSEFFRELLLLLYQSGLDPVFFVPFKYFSQIDISRRSEVDCELTCFLQVEQEYSDMYSLEDFLVLAQDGTVSRPCFPETALRYIAVTVMKALALLPREVEVSSGRKVAFEYSVLNPSTIMCSSDGCVKLAPPFFSPRSDCVDKKRFSAAKNALFRHESCNSVRDYSSPDERVVSHDAWALAVTLIELRTGVSFEFNASIEIIKAKLNATDLANIPALLWQEVAQSLKKFEEVFSENLMLFLQSLISLPSLFSTLQEHPWLSAQAPVQNLSNWFQSYSIQIKPWLNQDSLLSYVQNRYYSRDAAALAKFDGDLDMSNVCNIGDVNSSEWKHRGFPLIPPEIIKLAEKNKSWYPIHVFLQDLSAFGKEPLSFVRIMMVGIGEVGKTRLVKALNSHEGKSLEDISPQNRTVAAQVSEFKFEGHGDPRQNRTLTACVWDFAGQVEYYMTHSLFMSERAIYMLLWKRPNQLQRSVSDEERAGIVMWLQMLAAAVPNARIVVIGTHRETPRAGESATEYSACYQDLADEVHKIVRDQCAALNRDIERRKKSKKKGLKPAAGMELVHFGDVDSKTGFGVKDLKLKLHSLALQLPFVGIEIPSSYNFIEKCIRHLNTGGGGGGGAGRGGGHDVDDDEHDNDEDKGNDGGGIGDDDDHDDVGGAHQCDTILSRTEFLHLFREFQNRMLVRKYNKRIKEDRIRLMNIRDAEEFLRLQCAACEDEDDDGLSYESDGDPHQDNDEAEELFGVIGEEAQDSRSDAPLPATFQGQNYEPAPVAQEAQNAENVVVIPEQVVQETVEVEQLEGTMLLDEDIWKGVLFWHELGIVYVRDSFVIIRPQCIVDFLKPLVHRDPQMMLQADPHNDPDNILLQANVILQCGHGDSFEFQLKAVLARLKTHGAINVSDLKLFDVWSTLSQQKVDFMLEFLQNHHVLQRSAHDPNQLHVIARAHSNLISVSNSEQFSGPYQAFYIIREMHIDFLARAQSFLLGRQQFAKIELSSGRIEEIVSSKFSQGIRSGEVRMQPIKPCEITKLFGTIAESIVADFSFIIVVSASDFGFFSLGVRCAELFLSGHSLFYPCWLKNGAGKIYQIDTQQQQHALSLYFRPPGSVPDGDPCLNSPIPEALVANPEITKEPFCKIWGGVSDFCICHCTSQDDGTKKFKNIFFELFEMLCTCSCAVFDQTNGISREFVDCFTATKAIIFLLTPAFLCFAECVSMLHLALQLGAHIVVIPLYPSVSHVSRQMIIQTGILCNGHSVDRKPQFFKLSDECVCCLEGINQEDQSQQNDRWLKLRPWASDFSADWSSQGAYLTVSDFNDEHDPNGAVAMFAPVGSRNSKYALMNLLCQELLNLFQMTERSNKPASAKEHSHKCMESALPVDSPRFANSHRIFDKTRRPANFKQFLNDLITIGLSDEDVVQNCKLVQSSVVSEDTPCQVASFRIVVSPFSLNTAFFSDAFRQIAKKAKIGLDEISCLPIEALSERSDTSSVKSAESTRSLTTDSLTSLESLSFNSSSGSAQSLQSNASLVAIKCNCVILFRSLYPKYATEDILKLIEEKLTTLDEASLFLMTPEYLRPLEDCCGLGFVRCVEEVRRRYRTIPSFFDVRMDRIRSIVQEWNMELGDELGHGGFGKVFKCSLKSSKFRYGDNTHVAVKFVKFNKPARFFQEVSALSSLRHDNIVPVFDVYPEADSDSAAGSAVTDIAAYSMQLLPSGDLRKLIAGHHHSYVSQVAFLSIAEQLLGTLNFIHSKGHFHGDIKPENILWRLRFGDDFLFENVHIMLSDFGLVKTRDPQLHLSGLSASTLRRAEGSFCYLSPEQLKGEGVYTVADDTWSAALVLAELMCRTNIKEARGSVDLKFLYKRCPLHLARFVPAIHAALREDRTVRIVNPMSLFGCLKKPYYDVAVIYQPNSQNTDTGAAVELHKLFLKRGYYRPYICEVGKRLRKICEDVLYETLQDLGPTFEEVFAKLYVDVMTAMKSFVDKEKGGRITHSYGTSFDEANDTHVEFKTQISQRIRDDQRDHCSMAVNTNMQILVNELETLCCLANTEPCDVAAWLQCNSFSKCAFEIAKGCTGKVDVNHDAAVKQVVRFQDLDTLARCKILHNLLLFPEEARKAGKLLVEVRNKYLGHSKTPEISVKEYSEIMKCIVNLTHAFGTDVSSQSPSEIFMKECEIENICRSTFVIPILSDELLSSWTKQDQNHYRESDVLLSQCNVLVERLTSRESACPPDREHPHAGSSLREVLPVFVQRFSSSFVSRKSGINSMCNPCIERPYNRSLGVEKAVSFFGSCRDAILFLGSTSTQEQKMCQEIEGSLRQVMEARFEKQSYFCLVVCLDDKTKKSFSRLCPPRIFSPDRVQTADIMELLKSTDVIELVVVKTSGADLKCGDHLRKLNDDYVGQILDIAENGHDHLSRPKVRLTVSCIREVRLNVGDQLFPACCDQQKADGSGNATDFQDRVGTSTPHAFAHF